MSRLRTLLPVLALLFLPLASAADEAAEAPAADAMRAPIEALYGALLSVMKRADELGFQGRYAQLAPVIASSYDLDFMGSRVLGRRFMKLTPEQQAAWQKVFARLTISTYADRFDGFSGERFEIGAVEPSAAGTWIVRSRLVPEDDDPVEIDYRLRNGGDGWRIVDVFLSGTVSELALRRAEYSAVLKRDGFDALTAAVDEKIEEAEAGTSEGGS
jgi:phospholipid transport system substrate-binding protein